MLLDQLNLNQLRVFECVHKEGSMSGAARALHLTQSGVSQHIKALEEVLGVRLFDRIKQRLVPTAQGSQLFAECSGGLFRIEQALARIKDGGKSLQGSLSIGMPIEFGNNLVLPLLSEFNRKNPLVRFRLQLGFASTMNDLLLKGDLDFAFVDEFTMDRRIATEEVCDEILELCISEDELPDAANIRFDRRFFEALNYVDYEPGEPVLRMWFAHHLKQRNLPLKVRATVMDVQGIARLILTGMGAGVIPNHLYEKLRKEGHRLFRFKGRGRPLKNAISVAYLQERSHSLATQRLLDFLRISLLASARRQKPLPGL